MLCTHTHVVLHIKCSATSCFAWQTETAVTLHITDSCHQAKFRELLVICLCLVWGCCLPTLWPICAVLDQPYMISNNRQCQPMQGSNHAHVMQQRHVQWTEQIVMLCSGDSTLGTHESPTRRTRLPGFTHNPLWGDTQARGRDAQTSGPFEAAVPSSGPKAGRR